MKDAQRMLKLAQEHVKEIVPDADLTALAVSFTLIREEDLRLHAMVSHAGRLAVEAINLIARKAGATTASKNGQRLQRYLRDLLTYHSNHESTQFEAHATMLGRVRFGLEMWE